ncbi:hypothetical protein [Nocardioides sp.]|uniref:hypothetical protein n=1 Tax=Nocardioides sp. TaxID=35761 RepID=UPI002EDB3C67
MKLSGLVRDGVVVPVPVDPSGRSGPTRRQAAGEEWRRTSKGRYVPAYVDPALPAQRIVEAAVLLPGHGAVTGWAGLHWAGGRWFDGLGPDGRTALPVPLALGRNRVVRPRPGLALSEEWLDPAEVVRIDGLPATAHARSVCFEVRRARSLAQAVTAVDMAAFSDLASIEEIRRHAQRHLQGRPHVSRIARALDLADENAWSPREVSMRLAWSREHPRPLCNVPIFAPDGSHLLTPDLFDPDHGVIGEYDGLVHVGNGRLVRDLEREELARDLGLELVTMVAADNTDQRAFLSRLAAAYRRADGRRSRGSWTLDQPGWWIDTSTVERRRALSEAQRARWLPRQVARP